MKYFVDMLYYVMEHTLGMWGTVNITTNDHTDVTKATHCKNTCQKCIKMMFFQGLLQILLCNKDWSWTDLYTP